MEVVIREQDRRSRAGPPALTATLADEEPVVFWRDRWHWPWWSAGDFEARIGSLADSVLGHCDLQETAPGADLPTLVYDDRAHPAGWVAQQVGRRLGGRVATGGEVSTGEQRQVDQPEIGDVTSLGLWCEPAADPAPVVRAAEVDSTGGFSWSEDAGEIDAWVDRVEEAWSGQRPLPSNRRPAVLLTGATASRLHLAAARWGSQHRAAWLFGETGGYWLQDLLWSRPHVAFAGPAEVEALLGEVAGMDRRLVRGALRRRRLRQGLNRLRLLVAWDVAADAARSLGRDLRPFGASVVCAGSLREMRSD